jgi:alkylated DNA repair dioxygenase AlkB
LFGHDEPRIDVSFAAIERFELSHGAWVELQRGWLQGHARVFDLDREHTKWKSDDRIMYEKRVDVPRLYGTPPRDEIFEAMRGALDARYRTNFARLTCALYRDGRDSVAFHGDYVARRMPEALVATISVGAPRRFLLRPTGGGSSIGFSIGWGDLIVMGGSCQRTYQHAIPKVAHADPRIAIMYRPIWKDDGADDAPRTDR